MALWPQLKPNSLAVTARSRSMEQDAVCGARHSPWESLIGLLSISFPSKSRCRIHGKLMLWRRRHLNEEIRRNRRLEVSSHLSCLPHRPRNLLSGQSSSIPAMEEEILVRSAHQERWRKISSWMSASSYSD